MEKSSPMLGEYYSEDARVVGNDDTEKGNHKWVEANFLKYDNGTSRNRLFPPLGTTPELQSCVSRKSNIYL